MNGISIRGLKAKLRRLDDLLTTLGRQIARTSNSRAVANLELRRTLLENRRAELRRTLDIQLAEQTKRLLLDPNGDRQEYSRCTACNKTVDCCDCGAGVLPSVVWESEYVIPDPAVRMRHVRLLFNNDRYNYATNINGTRQEIAKYFNRPLQVSRLHEPEHFEQPIAIEFVPLLTRQIRIRIKLGGPNG